MPERRMPVAQLLRPIIDIYRTSAVALTGCHSQGIERGSCELDVIVVTREKRPPRSTRIGGTFVDLFFVDEKEVLKPSKPEHAVSMAQAKTLKDTSLVLSTSLASNMAMVADSARRSSRARLASSLKALGRADDALSRGFLPDADFWLLSASYEFACALLYSKELLPAPSHLLSQLKSQSRGQARGFEAFSRGAGLEKSSRGSCNARLEAIGVLHDLLGRAHEGGGASSSAWSKERFQIITAKARELGRNIEHAESYSFLGQEALKALLGVAWREAAGGRGKTKGPMLMNALAPETDGLLSGRLLDELGLDRPKVTIEVSLDLLREQVSRLARWV